MRNSDVSSESEQLITLVRGGN